MMSTDAKIRPANKRQRLAMLQKHDYYRLVSFAGQRWHWLFFDFGVQAAVRLGYNPSETLNTLWKQSVVLGGVREALTNGGPQAVEAFESIRKVTDRGFEELAGEIAGIFYAGVHPFYDVSIDEVLSLVTERSRKDLKCIALVEMLNVVRRDLGSVKRLQGMTAEQKAYCQTLGRAMQRVASQAAANRERSTWQVGPGGLLTPPSS